MANVMAGCRLNNVGDNICTGEHALFISDPGNQEIEKAYEAVKVESLHFPSVEVKMVFSDRKTFNTDINALIGNIICSDEDPICKGDKVAVLPQCEDKFNKKSFKVLDVFENGLVLLKKSAFSGQKMLVLLGCISIVSKK